MPSTETPIVRNAGVVASFKLRVRAEQGGVLRCQACRWTPTLSEWDDALHVHHIVPLSAGGLDRAPNLVVLCPNCHALAHKVFNSLSGGLMGLTRELLLDHLTLLRTDLPAWEHWRAGRQRGHARTRRLASRATRRARGRVIAETLRTTEG